MPHLPQGRGRVGLVSEIAGIGTFTNSQLSAAPADSLMLPARIDSSELLPVLTCCLT